MKWEKEVKRGVFVALLVLLVGGVFVEPILAQTPEKEKIQDKNRIPPEIRQKLKDIENIVPQSLQDIPSLGIMGETDCDYGFTPTYNVCMKDKVRFPIYNAYFKGVYVSVWSGSKIGEGTCLNCYGSGYPQTFTTYKSPTTILNEARQRHSSSISVHIKYFVQGTSKPDYAYAYILRLGLMIPYNLQAYRAIELWSEANYNRGTSTWTKYGYPDDYPDGGASRIKNAGSAYTSAGYKYHLDYPNYHPRSFGNPQISLASNFGHQYAIITT